VESSPQTASAAAQVCPLAIEPGLGLGPVRLGQTREQLVRAWADAEFTSTDDQTEFALVGSLHARLCGGTVDEVWMDDLRLAPDCVTYEGKSLSRTQSRMEFIGLFTGCKELPTRIGGAFVECLDGSVRIGYGMGEFIQVRVGKRGSSLDDECSHALDDGSPAPLGREELGDMLATIIDDVQLSDYWHPTEPGRTPLRVATSDLMPARPELRKFGEPVVYVPIENARGDGQPFFEVPRLHASATRATIHFAYAVEGLVGKAEFKRRHGEWRLEALTVAER
jgi:hypothetical protein